MSDIIQLLPDHVANQIAAGEVVQRPASVVKELLENAVDAGADNIQLVIKDAGRSLIQVIDNGRGMSVTDARMAFERHATSKIRKTEDLFHLTSKGFRGEALASIAAVAQVTLKTKQPEDSLGTELHIHGSEIKKQDPTVTQPGSMIAVKHLFYNIPARRNFLKSNSVEFRHILDEFHRVALAHPKIEMSLVHNDAEVYKLNSATPALRIVQLFGRKIEEKLISVQEETDIVSITGYIGKPEIAKKSRGEQFFFVNNRFIRSGYLHRALQSAFENLISPSHHPSYFLFLTIDPQKIDINIHPTKTEVKFEDEIAIYAQLRAACKMALNKFHVTPAIDFDQPQWEIPSLPKNQNIAPPQISVDRTYNPFEVESTHTSNNYTHHSQPQIPSAGGKYDIGTLHHHIEQEEQAPALDLPLHSHTALPWAEKYLLHVFHGNLMVIHRNRMHQTLLYHHFRSKDQSHVLSQQLLFPISIELNMQEKVALQDAEKLLISFGFGLEFQDQTIQFNALPADLPASMLPDVVRHYLSNEMHFEYDTHREHLAKSMAKSMAVRSGQHLSPDQTSNMLQEFLNLQNNVYSPAGKKNYHIISRQETDAQFT
ncbi:MAG: DNA mismatch repair endonuclease MutL [Weeksellaceae bacterium]|nr:DNA mismatch repair endonuclease MutL [Weeksellaceae bacterium]